MLLDGEVRGADAAVWRRADAGTSKGLRRSAPGLAPEVDELFLQLDRRG